MPKPSNAPIVPEEPGSDWIDDLTDDQCLEVYWLYLESPDEFFARYPKPLLGQALRYALREVMKESDAAGAPGTARVSQRPTKVL